MQTVAQNKNKGQIFLSVLFMEMFFATIQFLVHREFSLNTSGLQDFLNYPLSFLKYHPHYEDSNLSYPIVRNC